MSDAFHVDFQGLPQFEQAVSGAPKVLDAEMLVAARRISAQAEGIAKVAAPVWDGNLRSSIYGRGEATSTGVQAIWGASAEYAMPVDKGRRAGAPMPPSGVLVPWMTAHGIDESAEFVVRRKIGRDGIKARPFVTKAFNDLKAAGTFTKEFGDAVKRTIAKIAGHG